MNKNPDETPPRGVEQPPDLDAEDEAILDGIWDRIGKKEAAERAEKKKKETEERKKKEGK